MAQQSAAVVGGGIMGAGIAQVLARNGYDVAVREINEELADEARERVISGNYGLEGRRRRRLSPEDEMDEVLERMTFTTDLDAATDGTEFVIEAVTENLAIKGQVFPRPGRGHGRPAAVLEHERLRGDLDRQRRLRPISSRGDALLQPRRRHGHGRDRASARDRRGRRRARRGVDRRTRKNACYHR